MDTDRVIAGLFCFLLACCLCCCGSQECQTTKHDAAPVTLDMSGQCLPCSQTLPAVNCAPSLCVVTAAGACCVN